MVETLLSSQMLEYTRSSRHKNNKLFLCCLEKHFIWGTDCACVTKGNSVRAQAVSFFLSFFFRLFCLFFALSQGTEHARVHRKESASVNIFVFKVQGFFISTQG